MNYQAQNKAIKIKTTKLIDLIVILINYPIFVSLILLNQMPREISIPRNRIPILLLLLLTESIEIISQR